jgi:hypothetical protein
MKKGVDGRVKPGHDGESGLDDEFELSGGF